MTTAKTRRTKPESEDTPEEIEAKYRLLFRLLRRYRMKVEARRRTLEQERDGS